MCLQGGVAKTWGKYGGSQVGLYFRGSSSDHSPVILKLQIRLHPEPLKIVPRIDWIQFHQLTNDIDLLVKTINSEIKSIVDCATTKKPVNEFYKFDPHVHILTTNKNRARKVWQRYRSPEDKIIMNRAQQDLKDFLYRKRQDP